MKRKLKLIFSSIIIGIILGVLLCYLGWAEVERPTKQYMQMKEIDGNQTFIGLSKEEVKEILGEPARIYTDGEDIYVYNAGEIYEGVFIFKKHDYVLYINFGETGMVEFTRMRELP